MAERSERQPPAALFPEEELPDRFKTAMERYGVWPTTVWECDYSDQVTQTLKAEIGDACDVRPDAGGQRQRLRLRKGDRAISSARAECFTKGTDDKSVFRGKVTASVFNPATCAYLLNCYAPKSGICIDPFAGGGTRAIMAAKFGLDYHGVELRQEEVDAVRERCVRNGLNGERMVVRGDARELPFPAGFADFLITCPPYFDLEQYNGGPADLSMCATYRDFCAEMATVVSETRRVLKPGALSCWVVGLTRNKAGCLLPLHHDLAAIHADLGFRFKEEIVLYLKNTGALQRIGNFEKGDRRLVRVHEYALVFVR